MNNIQHFGKPNNIPKKSGIYKILNLLDGKFYIGSSKNMRHRFWEHNHYLKNNKHGNSYLQNAYNKYGNKFFIFEIIDFINKKLLLEIEQFYLDNLFPEYNIIKETNRPPYNEKLTEEHKSNIKKGMMKVSKVDWKIINDLRKFKKENPNIFIKDIAAKFNLNIGLVKNIINYETWKPENFVKPEKIFKNKLSKTNIIQIRNDFLKLKKIKKLFEFIFSYKISRVMCLSKILSLKYNISSSTIKSLIENKTGHLK